MQDDGIFLANTFEDAFGDARCKGVWNRLSKKVSSDINQYVVAPASFDGETRIFACTGFFIKWNGCTIILTSASLVRNPDDENKIDENLRIEVLLSNNRHREGTLQHYSLHYNVALVSVKDCLAIRPADTQPEWYKCFDVLAVGRCFKSDTIMAAKGRLVDWTGTLDCKLVYSSCKISKAGIGGPLVDLGGKVVGMNFYDKRIGTPFLLWNGILSILACFRGKRTVAEAGNCCYLSSGVPNWKRDGDDSKHLNRWPVPKPYWRRRDDPESEEDESDDEAGASSYAYINGRKFVYT